MHFFHYWLLLATIACVHIHSAKASRPNITGRVPAAKAKENARKLYFDPIKNVIRRGKSLEKAEAAPSSGKAPVELEAKDESVDDLEDGVVVTSGNQRAENVSNETSAEPSSEDLRIDADELEDDVGNNRESAPEEEIQEKSEDSNDENHEDTLTEARNEELNEDTNEEVGMGSNENENPEETNEDTNAEAEEPIIGGHSSQTLRRYDYEDVEELADLEDPEDISPERIAGDEDEFNYEDLETPPLEALEDTEDIYGDPPAREEEDLDRTPPRTQLLNPSKHRPPSRQPSKPIRKNSVSKHSNRRPSPERYSHKSDSYDNYQPSQKYHHVRQPPRRIPPRKSYPRRKYKPSLPIPYRPRTKPTESHVKTTVSKDSHKTAQTNTKTKTESVRKTQYGHLKDEKSEETNVNVDTHSAHKTEAEHHSPVENPLEKAIQATILSNLKFSPGESPEGFNVSAASSTRDGTKTPGAPAAISNQTEVGASEVPEISIPGTVAVKNPDLIIFPASRLELHPPDTAVMVTPPLSALPEPAALKHEAAAPSLGEISVAAEPLAISYATATGQVQSEEDKLCATK